MSLESSPRSRVSPVISPRIWIFVVFVLLVSHARAAEPDEDKETTTYQQLGIGEQGKVVGGGCVNWDNIRMTSVAHSSNGREWKGIKGGKMTLEECAKECKDTDGCKEFIHCSGSECSCVEKDEGGACVDQTGFCGLAKNHCLVRPNMLNRWKSYRFFPSCTEDFEESESKGKSDFVCPNSLPVGHKAKKHIQQGFFRKLHCKLINGNALQEGLLDNSFRERYFRMYHKELECLFTTYLDDRQQGGPCGGNPSYFDKRQKAWEYMCMAPGKASADVFSLMTPKEKLYWYKIKRDMAESQAYTTFLKLAGDKELMCFHMKVIDDECGAFQTPRMMPPLEIAKLVKPGVEPLLCKGLKFLSAKDGPCGHGLAAENMNNDPDGTWGVKESVTEESKKLRDSLSKQTNGKP